MPIPSEDTLGRLNKAASKLCGRKERAMAGPFSSQSRWQWSNCYLAGIDDALNKWLSFGSKKTLTVVRGSDR